MTSRDSNMSKVQVKSSDIQVGDLIIVEKNQRTPSDMVFLRTSEKADPEVADGRKRAQQMLSQDVLLGLPTASGRLVGKTTRPRMKSGGGWRTAVTFPRPGA
ncbi:uncharacterized protein LOC118356673 isoform X4 [Zalophus californianus]|uniref:Uncharacterized protein LOC118356673 isoform X4 n=1 Tax=Zalophus californianus TaxID=9704 RepID=A0A6P9FJG9_ZALCA|nr:uncharacterized protein LOC118356673 isoform X4 [Zalophus californianus]